MARKTAPNRLISASNITPATFAPFGVVVQNPATHNGQPGSLTPVEANQGSATKLVDVSHVDNHYHLSRSGKPAKPVMNMFVCRPRNLRQRDNKSVFDVNILERHPFTPQTFIPLGVSASDPDAKYLVIVAPTLSSRARTGSEDSLPAYPLPSPRRKKGLRERLLGGRPNPFTNDYNPSTTPRRASIEPPRMPKGPGEPDLDRLQAFIVSGDQAVTYGPGTWHAPMVVLGNKPMDFVVVQYANDVSMEDCQEIELVSEQGKEGLSVATEGDALDAASPGIMRAKL